MPVTLTEQSGPTCFCCPLPSPQTGLTDGTAQREAEKFPRHTPGSPRNCAAIENPEDVFRGQPLAGSFVRAAQASPVKEREHFKRYRCTAGLQRLARRRRPTPEQAQKQPGINGQACCATRANIPQLPAFPRALHTPASAAKPHQTGTWREKTSLPPARPA